MSVPPSTDYFEPLIVNYHYYLPARDGGWDVRPATERELASVPNYTCFPPPPPPAFQSSYQQGGYTSAGYAATQFPPSSPVSGSLRSPRRPSAAETMNSRAASIKFSDSPNYLAKSTGTASSRSGGRRERVDCTRKFPRYETTESGLLIGIERPEVFSIKWTEKYKGPKSLICSKDEQVHPKDTLAFEVYQHHIGTDINKTLVMTLRKGWKEGSKTDYTRDINDGAKEFFKHRYHLTTDDQLKTPLEDIGIQASLKWQTRYSDN